ncbi:hypothetical protein MY10362_009830 [Beauveria mimosiformis]
MAPHETADEAALGQDDWAKIQAMSQRALELYPGPGEGPAKRRRYEFEADTPLFGAAPAAASHPATCMDVFRADIERAIRTHLGNPESIELNCTGEGYRLQYKFPY